MAMMGEKESVLRQKLSYRQGAYATTFDREDHSNRAVMEDLAVFCRASESTFHTDARMHAVLEGRREVFLRIMDHIGLTPEEFFSKYTKPTAKQ